MKKISKKSVLLVCKDTGAANAFSSLVKEWKDYDIELYSICIGYAANVFKKNGLSITYAFEKDMRQEDVSMVMDSVKPASVLIGTSFDSMTERWCCVEAKKRNIFSLGFVDWWSSFGLRFSTPQTNDLMYLPDMIAVVDEDALLGCVDCGIPEGILKITGNPYWDYLLRAKETLCCLRQDLRKTINVADSSILAIVYSSYLSKFNLGLGYNENDFWGAVTPLPCKNKAGVPVKWLLKLHPKEVNSTASCLLKSKLYDICIADKLTAIELGLIADFTIGMCSTALFECALLGKKVISVQPGLDRKLSRFMRIFEHLKIPVVTERAETKDRLEMFINDEMPSPDLNYLPMSIKGGRSAVILRNLLLNRG
ncbi:MAG: hypothetical protein PHO70_00525 [Candidatus Omnitrophica bacterium]|nr:hypothetical protein [Candidatus Omnitrophota bacterium]